MKRFSFPLYGRLPYSPRRDFLILSFFCVLPSEFSQTHFFKLLKLIQVETGVFQEINCGSLFDFTEF